jgi:hypothetical protein
MDLESKRPSGPLFRVGRDDDAWAAPDCAYAKEDRTFGNRFDDPAGVYRVLYASSQRLGCFIETLARFRVDVSFVADLPLMENGEDDFTAFGTVRRAWIRGRCIGTANVEGEYADLYALGWVSHLRTALAGIAVKLGMKDFDLSSLEPVKPRGHGLWEKVVNGAPPMAPLLFPNLVGLAFIGLWAPIPHLEESAAGRSWLGSAYHWCHPAGLEESMES